jgi:hypothetical protein
MATRNAAATLISDAELQVSGSHNQYSHPLETTSAAPTQREVFTILDTVSQRVPDDSVSGHLQMASGPNGQGKAYSGWLRGGSDFWRTLRLAMILASLIIIVLIVMVGIALPEAIAGFVGFLKRVWTVALHLWAMRH